MKWIPVTERLPERGKRVWVNVDIGDGGFRDEAYLNHKDIWVDSGDRIVEINEDFNVTHWMELPSPPETV